MVRGIRLILIAPLCLAACAAQPPAAPAEDAATRAAGGACHAAIADTAGVPVAEVRMLEVNAGETGIEARAMVPGRKTAPWACFADRAGAVRGVTYTGVFP